MFKVRSAVRDDLADLHPMAPGVSYRAKVAELDGKVVGILGLALTRPRACVFFSGTEELKPHLKSIQMLRELKKFETMFKSRGLPVYAIRERDEPKAPAILKRLGFELVNEIDGDEIYEWRP